jgi:hypothetical protein
VTPSESRREGRDMSREETWHDGGTLGNTAACHATQHCSCLSLSRDYLGVVRQTSRATLRGASAICHKSVQLESLPKLADQFCSGASCDAGQTGRSCGR